MEQTSTRDIRLAIVLLVLGLAYYVFAILDVIGNARTWVDEVTYLVKSLWYVTGEVAPYSDQDPTWYMPLYFIQLGTWQQIFGSDITLSRAFSAVLGPLSGLLAFDVVRRLTGNWTAGALAMATFLSIPAVVFYFGTATPIATVSLFVMLAVWLTVLNVTKPALWRSLCIGLVFGVLYFYRQNMILLIIVLLPICLVAIRTNRIAHACAIAAGVLLVAAPLLIIFPDRLLSYAIRLPVLTPLLANLSLIDDPILMIQANTMGDVGLNLAIDKIRVEDILDAYALPYAGLILGALIIYLVAPEGLRILWLLPTVFLFLSVTHYLGSLDYCSTCILPYTASFAGIGAVCVGVSASIIYRISAGQILSNQIIVLGFAFCVFAYNETASGLATRDDYRYFPNPMLTNARPIGEQEETRQLAAFLRFNLDPTKPVLAIHDLVTVPYALALADHMMPVQSLNLRHSYRTLRPGLSDAERDATLGVLEREGLWTDELLNTWIDKTYDTIVFQSDPRGPDTGLEQVIEQSFTQIATTGFRGYNIYVYRRGVADPEPLAVSPSP